MEQTPKNTNMNTDLLLQEKEEDIRLLKEQMDALKRRAERVFFTTINL